MIEPNIISKGIEIIAAIILIVTVALTIAIVTIAERKIIGSCQRRYGPNKNGRTGILQPISDAGKLLISEIIIPSSSNKYSFVASALVIFVIGFAGYAVLPFNISSYYLDMSLSILFILVCNSLLIFSILFGGISSNSKYSILGSIRATSSMVSYEISLGLIIISQLFGTEYNVVEVYNNYAEISGGIIFYVNFILYIIVITAELGRVPFDVIEAESELTAGPFTEYSGMMFAKYFLVEYGSLLFHCFFCNLLFNVRLNLLSSSFLFNLFLTCFSSSIILSFAIIIRATLPRVKWDQLLQKNWLYVLPSSLTYLIAIILISKSLS